MCVRPIRLAVVNDYELVVAGLAAMLAPLREQVELVELDTGLPVLGDVDVVLYDTFGQGEGEGDQIEQLVQDSGAKVVVYSWNAAPAAVDESLRRGAAGYLSKSLSATEMVAALEKVQAGEVVRPARSDAGDREPASGSWPGQEHGLTPRESEVLALITQGLSNQEIADRTYLSINSVKTYIRSAYRKIGVTRRSQAVGWGMQHGFEPDVVRWTVAD